MSKLTIYSKDVSGVTIIPNVFIDKYMLSANGAYVKVYLYLLRCTENPNLDLSITYLADHLDVMENDIIRALMYWEKLSLLSLTKDANNDITSIGINPIPGSSSQSSADRYYDSIQSETAATYVDTPVVESSYRNRTLEGTITAEHATVVTPATIHPSVNDTNIQAAIGKPQETETVRPSYSQEKITQLTNNDEVKWMMQIIELYLNRPLKPMDIQLILYLYDDLKFSAELIMYLYEYCVSKNKKSASYIESVALAWAKEGIDTEEKAKEATALFQVNTSIVTKAFGLNRTPGQIEQDYISKWYQVYKFSDEIIGEACNRTILRTQKPDFKYADKILETWYKKNAKNMEDIAALDLAFTKGGTATNNRVPKPAVSKAPNKFNAFPQRNYSEADYANIEQRLLNKSYLNK